MSATLLQFVIALGLGLLVGLQRERQADVLAGFRTFPLVTVLGWLTATLAGQFGGWVLAAGFVGLAAQLVVGNWTRVKSGPADPGLTTEAAVLGMFALGAYLAVGEPGVAVMIGGVIAVLLHLKPQLHSLAGRIGDADFRAVIQFVLVSLVILPVLPDRGFGPLGVLNPRRIWWMVVLITGISLAGYAFYRALGRRAGTAAAGILGGLISSTATTLSSARRARGQPAAGPVAAGVIVLASAVVYARVLVLVGAAAPGQFLEVAPRPALMLLWMGLLAGWAWHRAGDDFTELPPAGNPTELKSALFFAGLYAAVTLAVALAREHFGPGALYAVATLSGLTDLDAITLSTAQLVHAGQLDGTVAGRVVMTASLSNLVFKAGLAVVVGSRSVARPVVRFLGAALAGGLALLLWP
ncbi:MAG: MgtC/SapB family protein [Verrucomicrobiota bacterium]